jgi:hypothetical protein
MKNKSFPNAYFAEKVTRRLIISTFCTKCDRDPLAVPRRRFYRTHYYHLQRIALHIQTTTVSALAWDACHTSRRNKDRLKNLLRSRACWEAGTCLATEGFSCPLWNRNVHCCTHNSWPLVSVLSKMDPVHVLTNF